MTRGQGNIAIGLLMAIAAQNMSGGHSVLMTLAASAAMLLGLLQDLMGDK